MTALPTPEEIEALARELDDLFKAYDSASGEQRGAAFSAAAALRALSARVAELEASLASTERHANDMREEGHKLFAERQDLRSRLALADKLAEAVETIWNADLVSLLTVLPSLREAITAYRAAKEP